MKKQSLFLFFALTQKRKGKDFVFSLFYFIIYIYIYTYFLLKLLTIKQSFLKIIRESEKGDQTKIIFSATTCNVHENHMCIRTYSPAIVVQIDIQLLLNS